MAADHTWVGARSTIDGIVEQRLQRRAPASAVGHPLTAPSLVFMMRFWKMKNITATGIVMIAAAASLSGYWLPWLSCPRRERRHTLRQRRELRRLRRDDEVATARSTSPGTTG